MTVRIRELVIKAEISTDKESHPYVVTGKTERAETERRNSLADDFYARDERKNRER